MMSLGGLRADQDKKEMFNFKLRLFNNLNRKTAVLGSPKKYKFKKNKFKNKIKYFK